MHFELSAHDIQKHAHTLVEFYGKFAEFFLTSTRSVASHALDYLKGILLLEGRRNMSRMSAKVTDKNKQSLSHFISNSPWKDEPLIEAIGGNAVEFLSGEEISGGLILDESGIAKQGTESVTELKPKVAILTHFGMSLWQAKPWEIAQRLAQQTGVRVPAARDGMRFDLSQLQESSTG